MPRRKADPVLEKSAQASDMFNHFCSAGTQKMILGLHREMCNYLNLKPNRLLDFYPKLKVYLAKSWKAAALFKKFDLRANQKVYANGRACPQNKVLIIGAGPCGLRTAIECQLLGAKVVVVEKRDRMSRNNVVHLWPFVIEDLKALGAKQFFGKFCAGDINHISIRQLQCILLKVALLLGVEFHESLNFEELLEPTVTTNFGVLGWRARFTPFEHPASQYEFDVLIGADGKRNTLHNFKRTEFRGKLALAITANFINRHTEQEAAVPEISGVVCIYRPEFFKAMNKVTGIDLENIVYYKDDTHYFVMTAKKHSLVSQGVLKQDFADVNKLLCVANVDRDKLLDYAKRAANFATEGKLPTLDFALNHYGDPDVALFDFTSMFSSENASSILERQGRRLLCQLVGDSLLEPFWPTGSGCGRGFLSSFDAAWAIRSFGQTPSPHPLEIIAERESVFRRLGQTTPSNTSRDLGAYTLDPGTRYPNLNRTIISPDSLRVKGFYDSDDPLPLDENSTTRKRKRAPEPEVNDEGLIAWVGYWIPGLKEAANCDAVAQVLRRYRPDIMSITDSQRIVYSILQKEFGIPTFSTTSSTRNVPIDKLRHYLHQVYNLFKGDIPHIDHHTSYYEQIKMNEEKEKRLKVTGNHQPSAFSTAAEVNKKKRRSSKAMVSNDPAEFLQKKIGKLAINDITKLARLIEGHDVIQNDNEHNTKQKELQEQIIALLDPEDFPDPKIFRESVSHLLQGATKTKLKSKEISEKSIARFFQDIATEQKPSKPLRNLKGLDVESIKVPDFSDLFDNSADMDTTVIKAEPELNSKIETTTNVKKKQFVRSASTDDSPLPPTIGRLSEVVIGHKERSLQSPEIQIHKGRSNSIGALETVHNTRCIAHIFEGNKQRYTSTPESRFVRSGSISNPEIVLRSQRMEEIIEGKRVSSSSPDRSKRSESIGNPEMALRRHKVAKLIEGYKPQRNLSPEPIPLRRNSGEISFRVQRVSDMMQKRNEKRPKTSRRKAAREIMKQRFEKSVQMLATEPRFDFVTIDLENDYGLQQYRASALRFGERVKKLENKLQHHTEARAVGSGTRGTRRGQRIIELAANLSGSSPVINLAPPSKPKDLLRAVGRLERDDWNVKEIEKRILENRLGRPEPGTAERVPKWDRIEFLDRQKRLKEGCSGNRMNENDDPKIDRTRRDSGRPEQGTNRVANLAKSFAAKSQEQGNILAPVKESVTRRKIWERPATTGMTCSYCSKSVFAAEAVIADGIHLHRSCFRCAVCKTTLRPGNYTTERNGVRLVCLRHGGISVPDTSAPDTAAPETEAPDTSAPDTAAPDTVAPDNAAPDTTAADTAAPGTAETDTAEPDTAELDTAEPDTAEPDTAEPDTAEPDTAETDTAEPDTAVSDIAEPDTAVTGRVKSPVLMMRTVIKPPERISIRLSVTGSIKIDEDEWTDRNFLQSETSGAGGGLSDVSESSEYDDDEDDDEDLAEYDDAEDDDGPVAMTRQKDSNQDSDDSFGYDDASDDVVESSGNESWSRMREAREARRKEVPTAQLPPTDSSEMESDEESESSEGVSSATEVSTDSEFAREEMAVQPPPPAILVTEPIPPPPPPRPQDYSLSRTRSAGGLATKRALELKRRYLLGEPSPPAVRKSDSTSQLDTKIEAFRTNITEFQKMLHPAPIAAARNITIAFHLNVEKPPEEVKSDRTLDSDSLSEDSHTQRMPNQTVPIVEVHNEGGELIEHNSTLINISTYNADEKVSGDVSGTTVVAAESESSESCPDATTLALTETELSDWAAESVVLDDCGLGDKEDRRRSKNPRTLSGPKIVHDAKNVTALSSHVCGRTSPEKVMFSNALEYFEFADEGDQDPSIEKSEHPVNEGFMEIVHEFDQDSPKSEQKNFIESFSEMIVKPNLNDTINRHFQSSMDVGTINRPDDSLTTYNKQVVNGTNYTESFNSDMSPPLEHSKIEDFIDTPKRTNHNKTNNNEEMISPPLTDDHYRAPKTTFRVYSPAICRSRSENFHHSTLPRTEDLFANTPALTFESSCTVNSNANDIFLSPSVIVMSSETSSSGSIAIPNNLSILSPHVYSMPSTIEKSSGSSPSPQQNKVLEINKDRQKQMEVVRGLVLERLGNRPRLNRRCSKRPRMTVVSNVPPPVPPLPTFQITPPQTPPSLDTCLPPPRPAPPVMPLLVMPSLSDPELTKEKRNKSILNSITKYLNRRLRPRDKWASELDLLQINRSLETMRHQNKSTGALEDLSFPLTAPSPVPSTSTSTDTRNTRQEIAIINLVSDEEEENAVSQYRTSYSGRDSDVIFVSEIRPSCDDTEDKDDSGSGSLPIENKKKNCTRSKLLRRGRGRSLTKF